MLKSKHFQLEHDMLDWANENIVKVVNHPILGDYVPIKSACYIISIIKDVTNGDWVIFYIEL